MPFDIALRQPFDGAQDRAQDTAQDRRFEFATATRIIFGAGALREVGPLTAKTGNRPGDGFRISTSATS